MQYYLSSTNFSYWLFLDSSYSGVETNQVKEMSFSKMCYEFGCSFLFVLMGL